MRLDKGDARGVQTGRGVRQGYYLSIILFNLYSEDPTKEVIEGFGVFRMGAEGISTVKYADDLVLLAKEEATLQGMIDRLIEIGRSYVLLMNVESK